jgi:hypothetical protein
MLRAIIAIALVVLTLPAQARDDGRYAQVNPEIKRWIEELKDNFGVGCCDTADGLALKPDAQDPDWECLAAGPIDRCRVRIEGQWYDVPDRALLKNTINRLGFPMVWYIIDNGVLTIRCFLKGTEM